MEANKRNVSCLKSNNINTKNAKIQNILLTQVKKIHHHVFFVNS